MKRLKLTFLFALAIAAWAQEPTAVQGSMTGSDYVTYYAGGHGVLVDNDTTTGTTQYKLAKYTTSGGGVAAIKITTADTTGIVGVVVQTDGATGNAKIMSAGHIPCAFDGATTAGDWVQASTTVAADCHDAGATYPSSGQVLGRVITTNASSGTYIVDMTWRAANAAPGTPGVMYGPGAVLLPNPVLVPLVVQAAGTGNVDLLAVQGGSAYVVPAGRRLMVTNLTMYNAGGNTCQVLLKRSSTYVPLTVSTAVGNIGLGFVFDAGDGVGINCSGTGNNVRVQAIEFDSTAEIDSVLVSTLLSTFSTSNTLYTVPSGKTAQILNSNVQFLNTNAGNVMLVNASGATRTYNIYVVPNGGSQNSATLYYATTSAANNSRTAATVSATLTAGESVQFTADAATAVQTAWLTKIEQ